MENKILPPDKQLAMIGIWAAQCQMTTILNMMKEASASEEDPAKRAFLVGQCTTLDILLALMTSLATGEDFQTPEALKHISADAMPKGPGHVPLGDADKERLLSSLDDMLKGLNGPKE